MQIFIVLITILSNSVSGIGFESIKSLICSDAGLGTKGLPSATSDVTVYKDRNLVRKHVREYLSYNVFEREVAMLLKLRGFLHVPKIMAVDVDNHDIYMEYGGEPVDQTNLPNNWRSQVKEIIDGFKARGIQHNDIKNAEVLVQDGVLKIVDYGWASTYGQPIDPSWPQGLGAAYKSPTGFDDRFSLIKAILSVQNFPQMPTIEQINDEIIAIFGKL